MEAQRQRGLFEEAPGQSLVAQPPSARLLGLLREHRRLLRDVAGKRRDLTRLEEDIRQVQTRVAPGLAAIVEGMKRLDGEIHVLFEKLLVPRRLPRPQRAQLQLFYEELQRTQILSDREADATPSARDRSERETDADSAEPPPPSAARPPSDQSGRVRELFRRLAAALHPDRAQDQPDQAARTEAMKEVNRAYRAGDLASLLQIERNWMDAGPLPSRPEEVERRCRQLQEINESLRQQLRDLRLEIRSLRTSEPARLARDAKMSGLAGDPIASFLAEGQEHVARLTRLRDDLRAFSDGKITLRQLLHGPLAESEDDADLFEEAVAILQDLVMQESAPPPPRRPSGRGKRRRR
jgi:hypothetical protein